MHYSLALALNGLLALASARVVTPAARVHERRELNANWVKATRLPADAVLPVRIGLAQSNLDHGAAVLSDIADPTSPQYGNQWTADEILAAFAPSQETTDAAMEWLQGAGLHRHRIHVAPNRGFLTFDASVAEIESLLQTEYYVFEHASSAHRAIACDHYHVPPALKDHIDFVTPGITLSTSPQIHRDLKPMERRSAPAPSATTASPAATSSTPFRVDPNSLANCGEKVTPKCVREMYSIPEVTDDCDQANELGIFESDTTYIQSDMDKFFHTLDPKIPAGTQPKKQLLNGAAMSKKFIENDAEPTLDFQIAWPLVYPSNITMFDAKANKSQLAASESLKNPLAVVALAGVVDPLEDVFEVIDSAKVPPTVLSISFGFNETDLSPAVIHRLCNDIMKLGLRGTTVVVASGDGGVASHNGGCKGPTGKIFVPSGLASCPWITAVGATQLHPNTSVHAPQVAGFMKSTTAMFASGGGFSNYFTPPKYQQDAVAHYLQNHAPSYPSYVYNGSASSIGANGGLYNRNGRGFPDVSAIGQNFVVVDNGHVNNQLGTGTSAATPLFASVVWKLNAARMAAKKKPIGFINPTLYAHPEVLNDIVQGDNPGCGTEGFKTSKGWDPVTGLGTPNFPKMHDLFMKLP